MFSKRFSLDGQPPTKQTKTEENCENSETDQPNRGTDVDTNWMDDFIANISLELATHDPTDEAPINKLPDTVLIQIFSHCLHPDKWQQGKDILCSVRLVCKKWFILARDMYIWQKTGIGRTYEDEFNMEIVDVRFSNQNLWNFVAYAPHASVLNLSCLEEYDERLTNEGVLQALAITQDVQCLRLTHGYDGQAQCDWFFRAKVAELCPNLTSLPCDCFISFPDAIADILKLRNLRSIALDDFFTFGEDNAKILFETCTKITTFEIGKSLTDNCIEHLVKFLPNLQDVTFGNPSLSSTEKLSLISGFKHLRRLRLTSLSLELDATSLKSIGDHCLELEEFSLEDCLLQSGSGLCHLIRNLKSLRSISLLEINIDDQDLHDLGTLTPNLTNVEIMDCSDITVDGVWSLVFALQDTVQKMTLPSRFDHLRYSLSLRLPHVPFIFW